MSQSSRISVYNQADLKNTSDDAIPGYLNSLKFEQTHFFTDVRLGLGYVAFLLAALCAGWDYYLGFEATKFYTAIAVGCYAVLNYGMTKWTRDVERNQVYVASSPDGKYEISIATKVKKNVPIYNLEVAVTEIAEAGGNDKKAPEPTVVKFSESFTKWFDESGLFVAKPFQEMLASHVPLIGKYDPKNVRTESQDLLGGNEELLNAVMGGGEATGAEAAAGSGSKKRRG